MHTTSVTLPAATYKRLEERAQRAGKEPEGLMKELLEHALQAQEQAHPQTARQILQASGRVRPLSETLRRKIIPGVTLDEVRASLSRAGGPALGDILLEHRGPKP